MLRKAHLHRILPFFSGLPLHIVYDIWECTCLAILAIDVAVTLERHLPKRIGESEVVRCGRV